MLAQKRGLLAGVLSKVLFLHFPLKAPLPALRPLPPFCQHPCQHSWQHLPGTLIEKIRPPPLRDPPVLKILRRVNFGTGRKFGTDVAKRYGEGSEILVFLGKRGWKTVQKVRNYG